MSKSMRQKKINLSFNFNGYDRILVGVLLILAFFGILAVFNSSSVLAAREFGDQFRFVWDQLQYFVFGLVALCLVSFFDYHRWFKLSVPLLLFNLILLIGVFIPGMGVKALGASRWINIGGFTLQPTELAKLTLVIYLSAWFAYKEKGRLLPFLILISLVGSLIILQPDLGTAIIITGIALVLYFISGASWLHLILLLPIIIIGSLFMALAAPYRLARITAFFNPNIDPLGSSYHIRQILIALGSGGWLGVGLGKSRQKYEYLPEASTDSIFAIIAEEVGFIGSLILILLFLMIIFRAFKIAQKAPDKFGQLLSVGIGSWFAIQTIINLASMVVILPLTGVPLPLISYGGSSLVSLLIGFGILLNIGKQTNLFR